jgi:hypothetical protein
MPAFDSPESVSKERTALKSGPFLFEYAVPHTLVLQHDLQRDADILGVLAGSAFLQPLFDMLPR